MQLSKILHFYCETKLHSMEVTVPGGYKKDSRTWLHKSSLTRLKSLEVATVGETQQQNDTTTTPLVGGEEGKRRDDCYYDNRHGDVTKKAVLPHEGDVKAELPHEGDVKAKLPHEGYVKTQLPLEGDVNKELPHEEGMMNKEMPLEGDVNKELPHEGYTNKELPHKGDLNAEKEEEAPPVLTSDVGGNIFKKDGRTWLHKSSVWSITKSMTQGARRMVAAARASMRGAGRQEQEMPPHDPTCDGDNGARHVTNVPTLMTSSPLTRTTDSGRDGSPVTSDVTYDVSQRPRGHHGVYTDHAPSSREATPRSKLRAWTKTEGREGTDVEGGVISNQTDNVEEVMKEDSDSDNTEHQHISVRSSRSHTNYFSIRSDLGFGGEDVLQDVQDEAVREDILVGIQQLQDIQVSHPQHTRKYTAPHHHPSPASSRSSLNDADLSLNADHSLNANLSLT